MKGRIVMNRMKGKIVMNSKDSLERITTGQHLFWAAKVVLAFVVPCVVFIAAGALLACATVR
jgi:hypothetical protein